MDELAKLDATAQGELVAAGQVSPVELVGAAVERAQAVNAAINAIVTPDYQHAVDRARAQTERLARGRGSGLPKFYGVPTLMKDFFGSQKGLPSYMGMRALQQAGLVEDVDSIVAERMRNAGLISLGRTNVPELALTLSTEPIAFGPTRNPWKPEHSAGGSSGGSAAAVAAGIVAVAHASDGGGSIRVPAAHCGLVGLKPSRARVSSGPMNGEMWCGFGCELAVCRTVWDAAAMLDILAGQAPGDPYGPLHPLSSYEAALDEAPGRLRVGLLLSSPFAKVDAECERAAVDAADALAAVGHQLEPFDASRFGSVDELFSSYMTILSCDTASAVGRVGDRIGRALTQDDVEFDTWALAGLGRETPATKFIDAIQMCHAFSRRVLGWWQDDLDLLLTPTTAEPPPVLGQFTSTSEEPMRGTARNIPFATFTAPFNVTGQPAISLPVRIAASGLPVGAQLVADGGREDLLLQVAAQLEEIFGWGGCRPDLLAADDAAPGNSPASR